MNSLLRIKELGQSVWLDYIRRDMIENGELAALIEDDGVTGMTSNPAIFEKAISGRTFYDDTIRNLASEGKSAEEIYEAIAVSDVQAAADLFYQVYWQTNGYDGYVSLEVNPHLAMDTDATVNEARRLAKMVDRKNVYIKVPATVPGISAIERLISEGININITLLFGLKRYRMVAEAYLRGLENMILSGLNISGVSSVASFFVSRMDTMTDPLIQEFVGKNGEQAHFGADIYGKVGVANAILARDIYNEIFNSSRFLKLKEKGAREQRLLWASTGTKNPEFPDTKYIDALMIPGTINTVPPETLNAYLDHGDPEKRNVPDLWQAREVMNELPEMGIGIDLITEKLEEEGIRKFNEPYDKMIKALQVKMVVLLR